MSGNKRFDLPLKYDTPATWAKQALQEPLLLLNDHAHLEKKAASNALELLNRWPEPNPPENWVAAMTQWLAMRSSIYRRFRVCSPGGVGALRGNIRIRTPVVCTSSSA